MAFYLGATKDTVDDILQNMYLKLAEINNNENGLQRITSPTYFIFATLRSEVVNAFRTTTKLQKIYIDEPTDSPEELEIEYQQLMEKVKLAIDQLPDYTLQVLELYFVCGYSIRDISKGTGISTYSIFNTLKNAKIHIKKLVNNDYKKYISEKIETETFSGTWRQNCEDYESDWD